MKNKIAIVGSNSFLAYYLAKKLQDIGHNLTGYAKTNKNSFTDTFVVFNHPINPLEFNDLLHFDCIIYAAGAGIQSNNEESSTEIFFLNAFLPIKIALFLENKKWEGKFVTFGSYFEIGFNNEQHFFTEHEVLLSKSMVPNDYCSSKRLLSRFLVNKESPLQHYHLILPTIYGHGENENRIIPYLLNNIVKNLPIKLTSGEQIRQYLHADDVANVVLLIVENPFPKGVYNLTQETPIRIKDLVYKVYNCLGQKPPDNIFGQSQRSDMAMSVLLLSGKKQQNIFNQLDTLSLEEGILSYL